MTHGKKRLKSYLEGKPLSPPYKPVGSDYGRSNGNWNPSDKLTARPCDNVSCWIDPNDPDCVRASIAIDTFERPVCRVCGITEEEKRHWYELEPMVQKNIVMRVCELGYTPAQFKDGVKRTITTIKDEKQHKRDLHHIAALFNVFLKGG